MTRVIHTLLLLAWFSGTGLRADLIGHWTFDQASLAETSGFRAAGTHDGVAGGTVKFSDDTPTGLPGLSLELIPGKAPFGVSIRNTSTNEAGYQDTFDELLRKSGQGTIAFWIKGTEEQNRSSTSDTRWVGLITKPGPLPSAAPRGFGVRFHYERRHVAFEAMQFKGPPVRLATGPVVLDGTWHHVAFVLDGQACRYYLDGVLQGSVPFEYSRWAQADGQSLYFGGEPTKLPFRGKLDDIRFYNEALDEAAILKLNVTPPTAAPR
jgi:hypothetical protein